MKIIEKEMTEVSKKKHLLHDKFASLGIVIPRLPEPLLPIGDPSVETMSTSSSYAYSMVFDIIQDNASRINPSLKVGNPDPHILADFCIPCHQLARVERQSPQTIAENITNKLSINPIPMIGAIDAQVGYINIKLEPNSYGSAVISQIESLGTHYGEQNIGNGATVVMDVSSPNVAKPMGVGHLRSTVIGESLARIYKNCGYRVIRDNHLGDWGSQFGLLMHARELWGNKIPELQTDPVKGLYKLYVKIHTAIQQQKEGQAKNYLTPLEIAGNEWFRRMEDGDPQANTLRDWASNLSMEEFQRVYTLLGTQYEYMLGESFYTSMDLPIVSAFVQQNLTKSDSNGGVVVETPKGFLKIQKADGASVYATRDLGTLVMRTDSFQPEKIIYVVGGEQIEYFSKLFSTFNLFTDNNGPETVHVPFGKMTLQSGEKFSTRKGNIVFLEEVLRDSIASARQKVVDNIVKRQNSDPSWTPSDDEIDTIARQIGVGAVIYSDLGQSRMRDIIFDKERALSFEGNNGPYLQYAYARAKSILRNAENKQMDLGTGDVHFDLTVEQNLVMELSRYPNAITEAIQKNEPSIVAVSIATIASLFNRFYHQAPIMIEPDEKKRQDRLRLTAASAQVIKNGLDLLCIEAPDRM